MWQIGSYLCILPVLYILFFVAKHIPKGNKGPTWSSLCLSSHSTLTALHSAAWSCVGAIRVWTKWAGQSPSTVVPMLAFVLCLFPPLGLYNTLPCTWSVFSLPPHPHSQPLLPGLPDPLSSESSLSLSVAVQGTFHRPPHSEWGPSVLYPPNTLFLKKKSCKQIIIKK